MGPGFPRKGDDLEGIFRPVVNNGEYPACGRYFKLYSVGGSSDAVFRWQYFGNLLVSPPHLLLVRF